MTVPAAELRRLRAIERAARALRRATSDAMKRAERKVGNRRGAALDAALARRSR